MNRVSGRQERERLLRRLVLVVLLPVYAVPLSGQNFSNGFRFFLPPRDTTAGEFLPVFEARPLAREDFITVGPEGHFLRSGARIRFFGTNLSAGGCFPAEEDAGFIAGRLRKMGFNLIRFHHMDNPWGEHIFAAGNGTRQLDPVMLGRLHCLLYQLRRNGLYANINLHVSRTFSEEDGVADAGNILNYGKGVTLFDPQLIALQKEYAAALLTSVSPYTGTALIDDPVMAMVEIVNENSLYRMWRDDALKPQSEGGDLIDRHDRMLDNLWTAYLSSRYPSTEALRSAWGEGSGAAASEELIYRGTFENNPQLHRWSLEEHEGAAASLGLEVANPGEGVVSARVTVQRTDGTAWHVQWKQSGLSLEKDTVYTLSFMARADARRSPAVTLMKDTSPWSVYASFTFEVSEQWRAYEFSFRAPAADQDDIRLSYQLGGATGFTCFDAISLKKSGTRGLMDDESLETETVRRIDYSDAAVYSDARVIDMSAFYLDVQKHFFADMHAYLKNALGVRVPVIGTNWNVGPADLAVQCGLDIIDNHAYWDHPRFPNTPWSPTDWLIHNEPMVRSADGGTIPVLMGGVGMSGKPFIVSEYNHAFPNRWQSEGIVFLTAYGAFHDLDGLMLFNYAGNNGGWENDCIDGFFDIQRNSAMLSLIPSCAAAFRRGDITPAAETIELRYGREEVLLLPKHSGTAWSGPETFPRTLALEHAVRTASFSDEAPLDTAALPFPGTSPWVSDTGQLTWDTESGLFAAESPRFIAVTGFFDENEGARAGCLEIGKSSGFGSLTWLSLTESPLASARYSLISFSTTAQNTGMVWDGLTSVHDDWGAPPVLMKPESCLLHLALAADTLLVRPLDERGNGTGTVSLYEKNNSGQFTIELDQTADRTVWFGLEARGAGIQPHEDDETGEPLLTIEEPFPNPLSFREAGAVSWLSYCLSAPAGVQITVFNSVGQTVCRIWEGDREAGEYSQQWDGTDSGGTRVGSGLYFVLFQAGTADRDARVIKKCTVIR